VPIQSLVFIDEFGALSNMTRRYARGPSNERIVGKTPHGHWKMLSTVAALSTGGIVAGATFDAPVNTESFTAFIEQALLPKLLANGGGQVVVMDNLSAHKSPRVAELLAQANARGLYLPPYSPDFNPIEMAIAKVKALLRKREARTLLTLGYAIGEALDAITPADALGFIGDCGYAARTE
jgi:transposase